MFLSCEEELPGILEHIEIVNFREAMTERSEDYEIAFVEGSISRKEEIPKLKRIRDTARVVVAFGACSSTGGINALKNRFPMDELKRLVYGKKSPVDTIPVVPIDSIIPVDVYIHGCPVPEKELLRVLKDLLLGKTPRIPNYPVCTDCKMAGNICVFEKGMGCVGPVTRGGCDAICVSYGCVCWGCRGVVDDPNISAHRGTLRKYGLTEEDILRSFSLYGSGYEKKRPEHKD